MDLLAHLIFSFWVSLHVGNVWAIFLGTIMDIDHLLGYIYDRRKKRYIEIPKLLHLAYRPRTWLHSFTGILLLSIPLLPFLPITVVFIPILSHLLLDILDKSGISIFPPFLKKKVRGALPVGYLIEDPSYLRRHKRSHIASLILIAIVILLMLYGV